VITLMRKSQRGRSGFTLVEMAVVLVVMGIALAVTVPSFRGSMRRARYDRAASELQSDLRLAVSQSRASGRTLRLSFTPNSYTVQDANDSTVIRERDFGSDVSFAATSDPLIFPWGLVQPAEVVMSGLHASHNFRILPTGKVEKE
jgi:type II secretion system protein H